MIIDFCGNALPQKGMVQAFDPSHQLSRYEVEIMDSIPAETIERVLNHKVRDRSQLIEVLQDVQEEFNYLPEEALRAIAERLAVPEIEVFRVANFYKAFTLQPRGQHLLTLCMGTACHVRAAERLLDQVKAQAGITAGETTEDGKLTLETVNCLGACALGPVAVVDGEYYDHMTPAKLRSVIGRLIREKTPVS